MKMDELQLHGEILTDRHNGEKIIISITPKAFKSKNGVDEFINQLKSEFGDVEINYIHKYSLEHALSMIIDFGTEVINNVDISTVCNHIGTKIYEHIEDKILDDLENKISKVLKNLKNSNIKENIKYPNKSSDLCFKWNMGVNIEMILKNPLELDKGDEYINNELINEIICKSLDYKNTFGAVSIQYIITKNEGYLNYIKTEYGEIIYSKKGL
jgi:hypothetical protein